MMKYSVNRQMANRNGLHITDNDNRAAARVAPTNPRISFVTVVRVLSLRDFPILLDKSGWPLKVTKKWLRIIINKFKFAGNFPKSQNEYLQLTRYKYEKKQINSHFTSGDRATMGRNSTSSGISKYLRWLCYSERSYWRNRIVVKWYSVRKHTILEWHKLGDKQ